MILNSFLFILTQPDNQKRIFEENRVNTMTELLEDKI